MVHVIFDAYTLTFRPS